MRCDPKRLKQLREQKGITQEKLSYVSRVPLRTIQRAEGGQSIRNENAAFIADALAVPLTELRVDDGAQSVEESGGNDSITLRRVRSGKALIEAIHRSYMCRLECDVDPDGSNVATLKAFVGLLEVRVPDPLDWTDDHLFTSLAERLEVIASLNDYLRELEGHGIAVFAGSYSERVRKPAVSPYEPPTIKPGTHPTFATLTRVAISNGDRERLVLEKDYRWPVAVWQEPAVWDADLDDEVPF
jgi:transcriptional regulator with XRE-family HTH domain